MASEGGAAESTLTSYKSLNIGVQSTSEVSTATSYLDKDGSFPSPTRRSPDDDIVLALQETTSNKSYFNKLCSFCGCCCCFVYSNNGGNDSNYISESSDLYWTKYPFMRRAHQMWKLFFFCYVLLCIPYIYFSFVIFETSCYNADIHHALGDVIDLNDLSANFCNLYYWIYIWLIPFLLLMIAYITERVTLHNDGRGDRLVCLLNVICLIIVIYLFVFFHDINKLLMNEICSDYQNSQSNLLQNGCKGLLLFVDRYFVRLQFIYFE